MIINLTQHPATAEQIAAGVVDLQGEQLEALKAALTFDDIPQYGEMARRAEIIADIAESCTGVGPRPVYAMLGGAPFFMAILDSAIHDRGMFPIFAFSRRVSVEERQPDGSVIKRNVFKHEGFVGL
jgi:hypothetical protein